MSITIKQTSKGLGLFAERMIRGGETIFIFEQNFIPTPTDKTLRVDEHRHQLSIDPTLPENFLNHSCEPSTYIEWDNLSLKALRDISHGEEITYSYLTSDWDGEDPFDCSCNSLKCKKQIKGFKYLSLNERLKIKNYISPFLERRIFTDLP